MATSVAIVHERHLRVRLPEDWECLHRHAFRRGPARRHRRRGRLRRMGGLPRARKASHSTIPHRRAHQASTFVRALSVRPSELPRSADSNRGTLTQRRMQTQAASETRRPLSDIRHLALMRHSNRPTAHRGTHAWGWCNSGSGSVACPPAAREAFPRPRRP